MPIDNAQFPSNWELSTDPRRHASLQYLLDQRRPGRPGSGPPATPTFTRRLQRHPRGPRAQNRRVEIVFERNTDPDPGPERS